MPLARRRVEPGFGSGWGRATRWARRAAVVCAAAGPRRRPRPRRGPRRDPNQRQWRRRGEMRKRFVLRLGRLIEPVVRRSGPGVQGGVAVPAPSRLVGGSATSIAVLLLHLLKWAYQPERRGKSWRLPIEEQRRQIARHRRDNPSLRSSLDEALQDAFGDAVLRAELETDLAPATCVVLPVLLERADRSRLLAGRWAPPPWHAKHSGASALPPAPRLAYARPAPFSGLAATPKPKLPTRCERPARRCISAPSAPSARTRRGTEPLAAHQPGIRDEEAAGRGVRADLPVRPGLAERRGQRTAAPEFTMLEWYRPGADMAGLIGETEAFLRSVLPPAVSCRGVTTGFSPVSSN